MKIEKDQIEYAALQIGYIDSGERNLFLDTVNTESQVEAVIFYDKEMAGVFYSCTANKGLRIHISFEADIGKFNEDIALYVHTSLKKSGMTSCLIWVRNENKVIIDFLKDKFKIPPGDGAYYYASIEFIMRREKYNKIINNSILEIRPYEERHIDNYLSMLDKSMTFTSQPPDFMGNKEYHLQHFAECVKNNSFEAFWKGNELIGLYWRKNAEIELIAVADNHQRKGYGSIILTRAIEMVFENTAEDYAYLYAVDWNVKGQSFYKKYGMEQNGHSYLLRLNNYTV